jgi:hypothetical protein
MGPELDVSVQVGSTSTMIFSVTHVMCQSIDSLDENNHIKYLARQRCVGASGNCTG